MAVFSWFERTQARADIFFWRLRSRSPASHSFARLDRPGRRVSRAVTSVASFAGTRVRVKSPSLVGSGLESPAGRPRSRPASSCREERGLPPSVPVARLGAIDARARTRLPNEIDMTIVDSGRESRVAAAARTAGIASASSSPGRIARRKARSPRTSPRLCRGATRSSSAPGSRRSLPSLRSPRSRSRRPSTTTPSRSTANRSTSARFAATSPSSSTSRRNDPCRTPTTPACANFARSTARTGSSWWRSPRTSSGARPRGRARWSARTRGGSSGSSSR